MWRSKAQGETHTHAYSTQMEVASGNVARARQRFLATQPRDSVYSPTAAVGRVSSVVIFVCLLRREYGPCGWCRRSGMLTDSCAPVADPCHDKVDWPGRACGY